MIIGFGHDICAIDRVAKLIAEFGDRFLQRCFTVDEINYAARRISNSMLYAATLAKRFAAKEAAAKALGVGIGAKAGLKDIEVKNNAVGKPELFLSGAAAAHLQTLLKSGSAAKLHLSLSDDAGLASAYVIIEQRD